MTVKTNFYKKCKDFYSSRLVQGSGRYVVYVIYLAENTDTVLGV